MKLYVCFNVLKNVRKVARPGGHPCGNAHVALKEAGYKPEVVPVGGLGMSPFDRTEGRRKVKEMTGNSWVPVLELDDGTLITQSRKIVAWAEANPVS